MPCDHESEWVGVVRRIVRSEAVRVACHGYIRIDAEELGGGWVVVAVDYVRCWWVRGGLVRPLVVVVGGSSAVGPAVG